MNRHSCQRSALGWVLGLAFLPGVMAQEVISGDGLPSAESILDRYVEVTGGAAAYESRTSEVATGTYEIAAAGLIGQLQTFVKPGLLRQILELPGVGRVESGVKDGVAWESNPITGPRIVDGFAGELMTVNARPGGAAQWREQYSSVEAVGIEDVNGEPAYRVAQTLGTSGSLAGFYGVDSGLLLKLEFPGEAPIQQLYEEYSELGGALMPTRVVTMTAGQRIVIQFTSYEVNVEIPDERFDLPENVQALLE